MSGRPIALFIACILIGQPFSKAQDGYRLVGDAILSSDCYNITQRPAGKSHTGAVWCNKVLNIAESFELEFTVNFDANPLDSDGIVFVMQTQGTAVLGTSGSGIGYGGLQPSFGIEFDTYRNGESADPNFDHIALVRDGNVDHRLNLSFAAPVPILTTLRSIKDGQNHHVKLKWNATTHLFQVHVDCLQRIAQSVDLVNDVFKGLDKVYWGVTASTGDAGNYHTVCLPDNIIVRNTIEVCSMENVTLVAGMAIDNNYQWKPQQGLNNYQIRTPQLTATKNQLYTVSYIDFCRSLKTDSIFLRIKSPELSIGGDRQVCENEDIELNPVSTPSNAVAKFKWSTGQTTPQLKPTTSGQYSLTITVDGCSASDSARVTFNPAPKLGLSAVPAYDCPGSQSIQLDPGATGSGLQYSWTPSASRAPTLMATTPGVYMVQITTGMGCSAIQKFTILDNCPSIQIFVPDAFTPNGDGVNDVFTWKGESRLEATMTVFDRWGEVLFTSTAFSPYWDGTYRGKPCPSDTYTWILKYWTQLATKQPGSTIQGKVLLLK